MRLRGGLLVAAAAALALSACTSSGGKSGAEWFEARALIMPGQHATQVRADPFRSVHVPANEQAYAALSPAQRSALKEALRGVDCAHPPAIPGSSVRVVCDADSDVFLLGSLIFNGNDVKKATPLPASDVNPQWSLSLSLNPAATGRLGRWTSQHHVASGTGTFNDVQTSSKPPCALFARTQCSDFLAYVSHDRVLTVPVTTAPTDSVITVYGPFDEASVSRLAREIAG